MKTTMALLIANEGNPTMLLGKVANLMGIEERTAENKVHAKTFPVPAFKLGSKWAVHVEDVGAWIDGLRAQAVKEQAR
jgi:hypothetical protein